MTFQEVKEKHIKTLSQIIPIVARVHGPHHPEMYDVQEVFNTIMDKVNRDTHAVDLIDEFKKLREITSDYTVPNDVCETYEAVYQLLSESDQIYQKEIGK